MPAPHRELAPAKLTLSLAVTGRRADGYHLIESEMVSVALGDILEFGEGDGLEVRDAIEWLGERPPLRVPGDGTNLVLQALSLARCPARVVLEKHVPPGAGLGGGSSDAAAALRFAGFSDLDKAVLLGADVPFCLLGGRAFVSGIGEHLEPAPFERRHFLVVTPALQVSTRLVYQAYDDLGPGRDDPGGNDLERAALVVEPGLERLRDLLSGALGGRPRLAGSGSSYFFEVDPNGEEALVAARDALKRAKVAAAAALTTTVAASIAAQA